MIKRVCALLLGVLLLFGTAFAETAGLDWVMGGYWGDEMHFNMTASINELVPYGEEAVNMMNGLLKYLSVSANVSETESSMRFCVSGDPIVALSEVQTADGLEMTTNLLPNRILKGSQSVMDELSGFEQQESQFDVLTAIREAEQCYRELTDAIKPYAEEKKASYSIKGVGSSRWSRIARLTPEQGAEVQPLIARVLGCGMDTAFREQLSGMEIQKGFIVGLYQTKENGDDLAVYIKGNVLFPDGAQRAISYQWAFAVNDKNQRVDSYKFDMSKNKSPRDNRQQSATLKRSAVDTSLLLDGQSKAVIRDPETSVTTTTTTTYDLSGKKGAMEGSWSQAVRTALGETASTVTLNVTPKLQLMDGALKGSVHIEQLQGKNPHVSIDLLFDDKAAGEVDIEDEPVIIYIVDERLPQSSLSQNMDWGKDEPEEYLVGKPPIGYTAYTVPQEETTVDLDSASDQELSSLMDEMTQRLAGHLLTAIAKLPEEATALIRDVISEADYAAFLELLSD